MKLIIHTLISQEIIHMAKFHISDEKEVFKQAIFKIDQATLTHLMPNGQMSPDITSLNFVRGDSVAALVHDVDSDKLIFTYQFRYPTTKHKDNRGEDLGWIYEVPAGSLPTGKDPEAHMREEMMEEIGYTVQKLEHIRTFYVSPGGTNERILLYYAQVTPHDQKGAGGGVASEGEYVERKSFGVDEAFRMFLQDPTVGDAKTIIALQWLQAKREAQRETQGQLQQNAQPPKRGFWARLFGS